MRQPEEASERLRPNGQPLFRTIGLADWREALAQSVINSARQQIQRITVIVKMDREISSRTERIRSADLDPMIRQASILGAADVMCHMYFGMPFSALPADLRTRAEKILIERARAIDASSDEIQDIADELVKRAASKIAQTCAPAPTA